MKNINQYLSRFSKKSTSRWYFWIVGFFALLWFVIRSGNNPKRITYPCQQVAYPLASAWLIGVVSLVGGTFFFKRILKISSGALILGVLGWSLLTQFSSNNSAAAVTTKQWQVDNPVSEIFMVEEIPSTNGSLAAGDISVPDASLSDPAVDSLVGLLNKSNTPFFKTTKSPQGIVGKSDVVILKCNFQWRHRMGTNTDRIKGVIWQILNHPEGFDGEILVCDNEESQIWPSNWLAGFNEFSNNSEDTDQSIVDVINTFKAKGRNVDYYVWDSLNDDVVDEYSAGDLNEGYIFDPVSKISYPKFTTPSGNYVSFSQGIWDDGAGSYDTEKLTIINFPVLKAHGIVGATIAMKNYIGVMNTTKHDEWFGGWVDDTFHPLYCFSEYALVARELEIAWPDLNIVDATFVATESNYDFNTNISHQKKILASTDPVAVSWYAAKYILTPIASYPGNTDPDRTEGIYGMYSTVLNHWCNYLRDSTSLTFTKDPAEISIITSDFPAVINVNNILLSSEGGINQVTVGNTLQFYKSTFPRDANDTSATWSVINGTGTASIDQNGLLQTTGAGTVDVRVTANDGSNIFGSFSVTINALPVSIDSLTVIVNDGGEASVAVSNSLQFGVRIYPDETTDKTVDWSVFEETGTASVNQAGLLTAASAGTVWVKAVSHSDKGVSDSLEVTITELPVPAVSLTISLSDPGDTLCMVNDTIQFEVEILPPEASGKGVTWSVMQETGAATINQTGLFKAVSAGRVWVKAVSDTDKGVSDSLIITIEESLIPEESLTVFLSDPGDTLCMVNDTIQFEVEIIPPEEYENAVIWSVISLDGGAEIDTAGKMTATAPGTVRVKAVLEETPVLTDSLEITIIEGIVPVESLTVQISGGGPSGVEPGDSLQLFVEVLPVNATNRGVIWKVDETSGVGSISESGLLVALLPGSI